MKKETRDSSRASARSGSSFSKGRVFSWTTASVAVAVLKRVVRWPGGRAKLRRRQSTRREKLTNPGVRIGEASTDASSDSEVAIQSMEMRRLRSSMAHRFSNVVLRGSLAWVRRDAFPS